MTRKFFWAAVASFGVVGSAHGQWVTEEFPMVAGWSAIYLPVDAGYAGIDTLLAGYPQIEEVWRWNPDTSGVQFITDPASPVALVPDWSRWVRGEPANSDMAFLSGRSAYLVKVADGAVAFNLEIKGRPLVPHYRWARSGLNFFGFETPRGAAPTFSSFFDAAPTVGAASKVYRYLGGALGAANPVQVFNRGTTGVNRGKAYWLESKQFGTYYGPLRITVGGGDGLAFGEEANVMKVRLENLGDGETTVTMTAVTSESPPAGEPANAGDVPLQVRRFDAGAGGFVFDPVTAALNETLAGGGTKELVLAVDRSAMGGAVGSVYQSVLRVTDSGGNVEIDLPVSAVVGGLSGLWVGVAVVDRVQNQLRRFEKDAEGNPVLAEDGSYVVDAGSVDTGISGVPKPFPLRVMLHREDDGTTRLLSQVYAGNVEGVTALATEEVTLDADAIGRAVRITTTHLPLSTRLNCSGSLGRTGDVEVTVTLAHDAASNPFVHVYHPDHDNLDARYETALPAGVESYEVRRAMTFSFQAALPGVDEPGWGSTVLGGTYREVITGVHKEAITVEGVFVLRRLSDIGTLADVAP